MRTKMKFLLAFILLCATSHSFGACGPTACAGKITRLYVNDGTTILVAMDQDMQPLFDAYNPGAAGCSPYARSSSFGGYFVLRESHKRFEEVYALLLTSKMIDENVTIRAVTGSATCDVGYVVSKD